MKFDEESVVKHIEEHDELVNRVKYIIRYVNDDDAFDVDIGVVNGVLSIYYNYSSRGYSYNDTLAFPISLLTADDSELDSFIENRRLQQIKENEEMKKKMEAEKIASEKRELERLKRKYEKQD